MRIFDRFRRKQKEKAEKRKEAQVKSDLAQREEGGSANEAPSALPKPAHEKRAASMFQILLAPHVTEKAARLAEDANQYVFRVADRATKKEITQAFEAVYGIRPQRIETIRIHRKPRRLGRTQGFKSGYKKAILTLPQGKKIEVMPR